MTDSRSRGRSQPRAASEEGPYGPSGEDLYGDEERGGRSGGRAGDRSGEFQESVNRLERAVDQLVDTARTQFADRATTFIDEAARRLEREGSAGDPENAPSRRTGSRRYDERLAPIPRKLYRATRGAKIGGVCAGIARYYGMEAWVVRCVAFTCLLFFPTIVFPAYWIAYFVMDKPPKTGSEPAPESRRARRRARRQARATTRGSAEYDAPAPELGPRRSPRYSLRNVQADLTEVELRLRRMETHVTSGHYELQREFNKIDGDGDGATAR